MPFSKHECECVSVMSVSRVRCPFYTDCDLKVGTRLPSYLRFGFQKRHAFGFCDRASKEEEEEEEEEEDLSVDGRPVLHRTQCLSLIGQN